MFFPLSRCYYCLTNNHRCNSEFVDECSEQLSQLRKEKRDVRKAFTDRKKAEREADGVDSDECVFHFLRERERKRKRKRKRTRTRE